jgi:hypothetical protein
MIINVLLLTAVALHKFFCGLFNGAVDRLVIFFKFQVIMAASVKMSLWDVAPCPDYGGSKHL